MREFLIPANYNEWRYCITVKCGLDLSPEFIEERIRQLTDVVDLETARFIELYGDNYRQLVLEWFGRASSHSII